MEAVHPQRIGGFELLATHVAEAWGAAALHVARPASQVLHSPAALGTNKVCLVQTQDIQLATAAPNIQLNQPLKSFRYVN